MKKFFCFRCQKEVKPHSLGKWRFCPECFRLMTDNGEGLYLICDKCGANMAPDAHYCPKCGSGANGYPDVEFLPEILRKSWLDWLMQGVLLFISILLTIGILYVSFYLIIFFFAACLVYFIYNSLRQMRF